MRRGSHGMSRAFRQLVTGLTLLVGSTIPAAGTVVLPTDLVELSHQAEVIVVGRVVDVEARRISASRIDSLVTFEPAQYLKGDYGDSVIFQVPGGREGRYRSVVVGAPVLRPGDRVVLFLRGRPPALPHLLGLSQGVFRLVVDPSSGGLLVSPPALVNPGPDAVAVVRGDPTRRLVSVAEFAQQVARALARPRPASLGSPR